MPVRGPVPGPSARAQGAREPVAAEATVGTEAPDAAVRAADPSAVAELAQSRFREVLGLVRDLPTELQPSATSSPLAVRAAAMSGHDVVDRDVAITRQLLTLANELRDAGTPGVALWKTLLSAAAEANLAREDLAPRERLDATVAQITAVTVGSAAGGYLQTFERLARFLPGATDPLAAELRETTLRLGRTGDELKDPRKLDPTEGADFAPAFRDGSRGQIAHTQFYLFIGYAVSRKTPLLAHLPNLFHETLDPSSTHKSRADWLVGAWGVEVGRLLRQLRDAGDADGALRAMPSIVEGAFAAAPDGEDAVAKAVQQVVGDQLERPLDRGPIARTLGALAGGLVSVFERVHRD